MTSVPFDLTSKIFLEIRALSSLWRKAFFLILLSMTHTAAFILGFPVHSHIQSFASYGSSRILEMIMGLGSDSLKLYGALICRPVVSYSHYK